MPPPENEIYIKLLRKLEAETLASEKRGDFLPSHDELQAAKQLAHLTELYCKPLWPLRTFGNHPIYFTKVKYENTDITYRRFDLKNRCWLAAYSLLAQIFYISGFFTLCYRCISGAFRASIIPGSGIEAKHSSATADGLVTAFFTIFFLACCAGAVISFLSSGRLTTYLNQWKDFVFLFSKAFPGQCVNFCRLQFAVYTMVTISTVICCTYLIWSPYIFRKCLFDFGVECTRYEIEQSYLFAGFGCASILNLTWEQCKMATMMTTTAHAFQQIGDALTIHMENRRLVHLKMLKDMFKLTYIVRGQVKLITKIVGTSQLFILFYLFGLTILIWMMFVQLSGGDLDMSLVIIIASIGIVQFGRFAMTSLLVERILSEEKKIMEQVSNLKMDSLKGQIEVQIFVNVLTKRPSEFVLNDFITYKRSLFLAIMSNCTSYLIAFQQLLDVSNNNSTTPTQTPVLNAIPTSP